MKRHLILYYFLFVLLILGTFASMAHNAYGLKICGIACIGFALTFLFEIFEPSKTFVDNTPAWLRTVELAAVTGVALIFVVRNFSIDFAHSNTVLSELLVVLLLSTTYQAFLEIRAARTITASIATPLVFYYAAIIVFIIALLSSTLIASLENTLLLIGFALSMLFFTLSIALRKRSATDEERNAVQYASELNNKSSLLLTTGLIIGTFTLVTALDILPPLYRGNIPPGYQELVDQGALNSNFQKAEAYKSGYDGFINKWGK